MKYVSVKSFELKSRLFSFILSTGVNEGINDDMASVSSGSGLMSSGNNVPDETTGVCSDNTAPASSSCGTSLEERDPIITAAKSPYPEDPTQVTKDYPFKISSKEPIAETEYPDLSAKKYCS